MRENVLLTGATGFVGRNLLEILADRFNIYCLTRKPTKVENAEVITIKNPERCEEKIYRNLTFENDINIVIHVAAITGEKLLSWHDYYITNVLWTKNLALGFLNANVDHDRFIFISTVGVYGTNPEKLPADEKTRYNPDGKYHLSKVLAENELIKLKEDYSLPLIIFRPTIMYGLWDYGFLYKLSRLMKRKINPIFSNPLIHLLDVRKVGEVCLKAIRKKIYGVYNLCDDSPIYLKEVLEYLTEKNCEHYLDFPKKICKFMELIFLDSMKIRLKLLCKPWYYDNSKIKAELKMNFGETKSNLNRYIKWYTR